MSPSQHIYILLYMSTGDTGTSTDSCPGGDCEMLDVRQVQDPIKLSNVKELNVTLAQAMV